MTYDPPDQPIAVQVCPAAGAAAIAVRSQRPAIAADGRPRVFVPFMRGATTRDAERRLGLGLYVGREILAAHGGTLEAASSLDSGTPFTVILPRRP